mmetsp:Transcript_26954/g.83442  ORF Transcript_26954/g.83442 Transcript_26954/m.83442 type:complete len:207 (+) Transcript_26954:236-856(+)
MPLSRRSTCPVRPSHVALASKWREAQPKVGSKPSCVHSTAPLPRNSPRSRWQLRASRECCAPTRSRRTLAAPWSRARSDSFMRSHRPPWRRRHPPAACTHCFGKSCRMTWPTNGCTFSTAIRNRPLTTRTFRRARVPPVQRTLRRCRCTCASAMRSTLPLSATTGVARTQRWRPSRPMSGRLEWFARSSTHSEKARQNFRARRFGG